MPLELTPDGNLHGIIDGPLGSDGQRIDEYMVRVTDAGPAGATGEPGPDDPPVTRSVWIRAEAGWLVDELVKTLPPGLPVAGRIDEFTCSVGGTPEFLKLTPSDAYQVVENMLGNLTALMHAYSPNTRRRYEVWQVSELHKSGRQSAIKRLQMTVSATDGMVTLRKSVDGDLSRCTVLLVLAQSNGQVSEALALLQNPEPAWAAVYDALKFVAGSPVATGKKKKIDKYRGTASWYRHLGEPNRPAKPDNAPDLIQARAFAFGLLREWLDLKVSEYLDSHKAAAS